MPALPDSSDPVVGECGSHLASEKGRRLKLEAGASARACRAALGSGKMTRAVESFTHLQEAM